jgi:branched-subunit amino acid transport protein
MVCKMTSLFVEIFVIGAGTYLIRGGSLSWGSRMVWPVWVQNWLSFVAPAVLGALLGPLLLLPNHHFVPLIHNPTLIAAIPTAIAGWYTRNLLWTVAVGVISFAVISHWF